MYIYLCYINAPCAILQLMSEEFCESLGHETDGLVFQPAGPVDVSLLGGSMMYKRD